MTSEILLSLITLNIILFEWCIVYRAGDEHNKPDYHTNHPQYVGFIGFKIN